ncbi:MAG: hypothetical protein WBB79_09950, partial [Candidatus Macondimonas sp.]
LCGTQENLQRKAIKTMLQDWERQYPGRLDSIFAAMRNVGPAHLADPKLFDFAALGARQATPVNWLASTSEAMPAPVDNGAQPLVFFDRAGG